MVTLRRGILLLGYICSLIIQVEGGKYKKKTTYYFKPDPNMKALNVYRKGFSTGDIDLIFQVINEQFQFTWVPGRNKMNKSEYKNFFLEFKSSVENELGKFLMRFDHTTVWQVDMRRNDKED